MRTLLTLCALATVGGAAFFLCLAMADLRDVLRGRAFGVEDAAISVLLNFGLMAMIATGLHSLAALWL